MDISNIKEIFALIKELIKKGATLEAQQKIIELEEKVLLLQEENIKLKKENLSLREQLENWEKGDRCPRCRQRTWNLIESKPHPIFGDVGVLERKYQCSECGHTENPLYDPSSSKK